MDLSTRYLGLDLESPLMLGACPLVADIDAMRRAEDSGASAIVMRSLFEEQLTRKDEGSYYPADRREFAFRPVEYLEQLSKLKAALRVPVIGSLNGVTTRGWIEYAKLIDQAGADALELNVYRVCADFEQKGATIEDQTVELVRNVVSATHIPVSVKLSPFYTALPDLAQRLVDAGAKGLVLFNRFYQPDIDLAKLEVTSRFTHSSSDELLLRLRWLAILSPKLDISFAVGGGVHDADDALKAVLTGAHGVQLVSEVLQHGFVRFAKIRAGMATWLNDRGAASLASMRGRMNLSEALNPEAYERANYLHVLHSYPDVREATACSIS
jgi:dihydroorotate dehydrogenase (fumarate)